MANPRNHRHRIVPGHAGGTYVPNNVTELSVTDHAEAHRLLWLFHGKREDEIAWKALSGQISKQEAILEAIREGAKKRIGRVVSMETRARTSKTLKVRRLSDETKRKRRESQMGRVRAVTAETCANISQALTASWARRKAA